MGTSVTRLMFKVQKVRYKLTQEAVICTQIFQVKSKSDI